MISRSYFRINQSSIYLSSQEIEDKKKSQIVNMQSTELREKSFQAAKLEQKIAGLEHDLQLVNIEHAEQVIN